MNFRELPSVTIGKGGLRSMRIGMPRESEPAPAQFEIRRLSRPIAFYIEMRKHKRNSPDTENPYYDELADALYVLKRFGFPQDRILALILVNSLAPKE